MARGRKPRACQPPLKPRFCRPLRLPDRRGPLHEAVSLQETVSLQEAVSLQEREGRAVGRCPPFLPCGLATPPRKALPPLPAPEYRDGSVCPPLPPAVENASLATSRAVSLPALRRNPKLIVNLTLISIGGAWSPLRPDPAWTQPDGCGTTGSAESGRSNADSRPAARYRPG